MAKNAPYNKGVALMIALMVMLFLSILSSAAFLRYTAEQATSQREKALAQAFYAAEEGINYAYAELSQHYFDWNTHTWQGTTTLVPNSVTSSFQAQGGSFNVDGSYYINDADNPHYFKVITYPELDTAGTATGITVVHSQGADPKGISQRTLELRVTKSSMFDYFYFFPSDKTFSSATYDGAGYGKIHVNGAITFSGTPNFTNLAELSTADTAHNGYYYLYNSQYSSPLSWDDDNPYSAIDGVAPMPKDGAPPYGIYLSSDLYEPYAKFNWDQSILVDGVKLPNQLDTSWAWDKYSGDKSASEIPTSFKVDNSTLAWLTYKNGDGAILSGEDYTNFISNPSGFDWETWKVNNGYIDANTDTTGALARKFWTTWQGANPTHVNQEWWSDLVYGNDRSTSDYVDINYLNTKEQPGDWQSWLNDDSNRATITQADTGETLTPPMSDVIKDGSTGATYLTPIGLNNDSYRLKAQDGGISLIKGYSSSYQDWLNQPQTFTYGGQTITYTVGEVVIGRRIGVCIPSISWVVNICRTYFPTDCQGFYDAFRQNLSLNVCPTMPTTMYSWDIDSGLLSSGAITTDVGFYNFIRPAGVSESPWASPRFNDTNPKETLVLDIDVAKLRQYLADSGRSFNGVIYIEDLDYTDTSKDFSVRLTNGGILPENGLTVVTPHNIYVQGSFNLDKSRDGQVAADYQAAHGGSDSDYTWRPAALISSKRAIYTVSEDFNPNTNSLAETKPFKYWESFSANSWPYCLSNTNFLNYFNSGEVSIPQQVLDFAAKYSITLPSTWTAENIAQIFDTSKYPDAGSAQQAMLSAGEAKYESDNEANMPNRVSKDTIYNTAMVSPYDPQGYTLERWIDASGNRKKRQITGSFIQLQETERQFIPLAYNVYIYNENGNWLKTYYQVDPGYNTRTCFSDGHCINGRLYQETLFPGTYYYGYYYRGYYSPYYYDPWSYPTNTYGYEINFAKESGSGSTSSLSASGIVSWLEIPNNDFCAKCQ